LGRVNIDPHVAANDKFDRGLFTRSMINFGIDRNSLKRPAFPQASGEGVLLFRLFLPLCHKSKSYDKPRATRLSSPTVLATHHTDGSRHGVTSGVIVFPATAAVAAAAAVAAVAIAAGKQIRRYGASGRILNGPELAHSAEWRSKRDAEGENE